MNIELAELYKESSKYLDLDANLMKLISPPMLLRITDKYENHKSKVLVLGQETKGWGAENIGFEAFDTFITNTNSVECLCDLYEGFCFAKWSSHKKSPFWRAFRQLAKMSFGEEIFESNVIWSNLVKVDYNRASIKKMAWENQLKILEYSKKILERELQILKPTTCVLFTGPNYDSFVAHILGKQEYVAVLDKYPVEEFARFEREGIPFYRTYHPSYLQRSGKWEIVDYLEQLISENLR